MKVQIKKRVLVDVNKIRLGEIWEKEFPKWEILQIEEIVPNGKTADLINYDGDIFIGLPTDSFEII